MNKNRRRVPILVSVRSSEEAKLALNSGADYIDAKEPSEGALGNLPVNKIKEIISTLKVENFSGKVTATYGDSFEEKIDFNAVSNTISLHRKKITNTLYTINALNELIKTINNGVLDTNYQVEWDTYKNMILIFYL